MTVKAVVFAILLVFTIVLMVYLLEFFPPLSVKSEMNTYCRNALLKMEIQGGMSTDIKDELENRLLALGLKEITIDPHGDSKVKQGEEMTLTVEANYVYSRFKDLFTRESVTQKMVYSKTAISRKVIN